MKNNRTVVKVVESDLIWKSYCNGEKRLQYSTELNSEFSEKWGFIAKAQKGWAGGGKFSKRKHLGKGC